MPINLGNGNGITIKEVTETIASLINPSPEIIWDIEKPSGDPCRILSMDRAKEVLGYHQKTSLKDGLGKTINWYKANKHLKNK